MQFRVNWWVVSSVMLRLSCLKVYYCPSKQIHRLASWFSHRTEVVWESGTPPVVFGSSFAKRMGRHLFLFFCFYNTSSKTFAIFSQKKIHELVSTIFKKLFYTFLWEFCKGTFLGRFFIRNENSTFFWRTSSNKSPQKNLYKTYANMFLANSF